MPKTGQTVISIRRFLPAGRSLPDDVWRSRHRTIVTILWIHAGGLAAFALIRGYSIPHSLFEGSIVALAAVATYVPQSRRGKAFAATFGLLAASAVLVHISNGAIEAHFHYFVMLGLVLLYQDWVPFLMYITFVLMQHSVMGMIDPGSVYNHPAGTANPWIWGMIHALFIAGASAVGFIVWRSNEDLRSKARSYYRRLYEGERAVAHLKDELVSTVSHEFRTPLAAILGYARTMQNMWEQLPESEVREYIGIIDRRASQLSSMIDQLLISSHVEAADIQANTKTLSVPAALDDVAKLEHGVQFAVQCRADLSVSADPVALQQILINYMSNARKYGGAPFTLEARRRDGWIEIQVRDEGEGVPDEVVARLFERFGPGHRDATREGLGLGLSIVRALAQAQGGEAWYEPNSPRGACFGVRLPIAVPEPVDSLTSLSGLAAAG